MRKTLYLYLFILSSQIHANDSPKPLSLESSATKIDVILMSLYARLGCKGNYYLEKELSSGVVSVDLGILEPELCLSDLNYLPNTETVRMEFSISGNHHFVSGFEKLNDEKKSKVVLSIANSIEDAAERELRVFSLLSQTTSRLKFEFIISYNGYRVLRNNKSEVHLTKYEFTKGF
jgi:hypothetical protein